MKSRKRHGRRRANRGTPRETPSILSRRAVRRARKADRVERYWQARGLRVTSVPGAVIVHVNSPGGPVSGMPDPGDPDTWLPTVRPAGGFERMAQLRRYDREIAHARARGLPLTAERIEQERAEFLEVGE